MRGVWSAIGWATVAVSAVGAVLMLVVALANGGDDRSFALLQILPSSVLMLLLGSGVGGALILLASIDGRLEALQKKDTTR